MIIASWLLTCCAMVFAMVILGGLTRLTHSGLSMVEWKPLTGWIPPLGDAEWMSLFDKYRQFPEYKKLNYGMSLDEFKAIFWFEFSHRVLGRLVGIIFFVPMVFFIVRGWVDRKMAPKLVVMFVLGGFQGLLGWYMVKSGLVDRPDVSQYRLAAHFGAALVIHVYMFWVALGLLFPNTHPVAERHVRTLRTGSVVIAIWTFVTAISGGFVAGLDAGFTYNTFPLMDGDFIPDGLFMESPLWINFFENITTVQFSHRILAELLFLAVLLFWIRSRKANLAVRTRQSVNALMLMVSVQAILGITTLLLVVPVPLASAHQAGAFLLLTIATWTAHEFREGS
ncbi:MAG: COX15/CtaA family protein [Rhodospirillales bacterium]|nr:COX15/CtaA family protein [Rhodospirillales bacterium]MCW8862550.1 COX15/CtaA family protein [Rhodospirillales bacterium]MCW8970340.1 COX15/CtaA family protein [Rhodospirillales bacterium]MCW9001183.1 COX15/CtaA family protein [Rhodospirillales bacterium]